MFGLDDALSEYTKGSSSCPDIAAAAAALPLQNDSGRI